MPSHDPNRCERFGPKFGNIPYHSRIGTGKNRLGNTCNDSRNGQLLNSFKGNMVLWFFQEAKLHIPKGKTETAVIIYS